MSGRNLFALGLSAVGDRRVHRGIPIFATIPELDLYACCDLQAALAERNARFFRSEKMVHKFV